MPSNAEKFDFVMGFVANSKDFKAQYIERWQEVLSNYVVEPEGITVNSPTTPFSQADRRGIWHPRGIVLKDGETHKAIMTLASSLVLTMLGDAKGEFVKAEPVGWEDAPSKAPTVTRLLRYAFNLPGHFRTLVEAVVDMLLFGTAVVEISWKHVVREMPVRRFETIAFPEGPVELDTVTRQPVVAYDDPLISVVDNADFFPDPAEYRIENMAGVAKRFKISAMRARSLAERGIYDKEAVERAIANSQRSDDPADPEDFREGRDQPRDRKMHPDFIPLVGFEYSGEVPWREEDGTSRRVITVLNAEVVRDRPYPFADADLPFRSLVINPVVGRFYGVSPAEVIRFDQDLQDAVKILLAEAIIRQVHPPIAYDPDSDLDQAMLRRWSPDVPIPIRGGPNSVGTLRYDANVFSGFQMAAMEKQAMQETSGAVAALQGQPFGTKRISATEAQATFQQALSRPELAAALLERESMPLIAKSIIRRYQQFLDDTDALKDRVGDLPESVWIGDIMGDFDVQFVGSRLAMSRQQKLQAYDRLAALTGALPQAAAMVPWQLLLQSLIGDVLELPEVAAQVANPQVMQANLMLSQIDQQRRTGNGNGEVETAEPAGILPAQVAGGSLG